ncbi:hypothetical protein EZV62_017256 [Acer yangbiense]|uniref:Rx N-terminal domain-containing protein n=1 Tax=Acer yangbiense TaxID=1000413 RepID=A0A5C7HFM9_9ROSI|nr:hypothetical protein EZV62_017256 [Acer yangbiense]
MDDAFAKFMADRFRYLIDKIDSQYFTDFFRRQKLDEALLNKLKRNMLIIHQVLVDNEHKRRFRHLGEAMLDLDSLLDEAVAAAESLLLSFGAKSQPNTNQTGSSISSEFTSLGKNDMQLHDAGKEEFESNEKLVIRPLRLSVIEELKSLDSNVVQLKSDDEFASQRSERRTDVSTISHSSPGESFKLLPENSSIKLEGASFDNDSYDLINLFYPPDILHDINSPNSLKISEISQLEELPPRLHSLKISECLRFKETPPRLQIVDDMQLHDASKVVQLKSADEFSLQHSEHRTDVSITSDNSPGESFKLFHENSSNKHEGASSDSDGDDLISIWYSPDICLKVSEISQLEELPQRLHSLKIEGCHALKSLPQEVMCGSPHLQHLYIIDCCYLELFRGGHLPVALKSLYIRNCRKLDFLSLEETMPEHALLEHLCMGSSCDSLRCFPLTFFPKLRSLSIWDSANFDSISITKNHMSLHAIEIRDCHKLLYFPKGGLLTPNLTSILLSNCKNLKVLPDQLYRLTSLQSLLINECPELDSIPEGGFPCSLDLLRITSCNKLTPCTEWGMNKLNNLSCFEIEGGCRDLESFPEEKLLPSNLNSLRISRLSNLKFLDYKGLEHLKSLETLEINCCDKLQSLPEGLPSSLTYLYIKDCPLLKSKLQNRRGKEWYKIAHIPHIQIDEEVQ